VGNCKPGADDPFQAGRGARGRATGSHCTLFTGDAKRGHCKIQKGPLTNYGDEIAAALALAFSICFMPQPCPHVVSCASGFIIDAIFRHSSCPELAERSQCSVLREPRQRSATYSAPRRGFWPHCESRRHYFRNKRVFQAVRRPDGELSQAIGARPIEVGASCFSAGSWR
jgi:hypothetical protein